MGVYVTLDRGTYEPASLVFRGGSRVARWAPFVVLQLTRPWYARYTSGHALEPPLPALALFCAFLAQLTMPSLVCPQTRQESPRDTA